MCYTIQVLKAATAVHVMPALPNELKQNAGMLLLDIEKAYDTVWLTGLLYKLITIKVPTYLLWILKAFLTERNFMVHVNDESSSFKTTPAGLPQGAVLSTSLFSPYISDIPHPPNSHLALYADDTAILTQSWRTDTIVNRLTQASSTLFRYFTKWKLRINVRNSFHQTPFPYPYPSPQSRHGYPMKHPSPLPRCHPSLQTPFYHTYHYSHSSSLQRSPPPLPFSSPGFNVISLQ